MMDAMLQDVEAGIPANHPRASNKKMRKRKQLNSLLQFRTTKKHSNDLLRSSEDELFLPQRRPPMARHTLARYNCPKYSQCLFSTVILSIFVTACVGLIYTNMELKRDVQDLSVRLNEMEKRYSKIDVPDVLSVVEQLKARVNVLERWNLSVIYSQLQKLQARVLLYDVDADPFNSQHSKQKSSESLEITNNAKKLQQLSEIMINDSAATWVEQLNALRTDMRKINRTEQLQDLVTRFDQLAHWAHNSSSRTSLMFIGLQSNLDRLQRQIDQCPCAQRTSTTRATGSDHDPHENDEVEKIVNQRPTAN